MTISKDLFLALLSMDTYNEGYGSDVQLPGIEQGATLQSLGSATVLTSSSLVLLDPVTHQPLDQPAGFYAIAYQTTADVGDPNNGGVIPAGTIIISYRGTDSPLGTTPNAGGSDVANGYGLGAGSATAPQALMAVQFYQAVAAANPGATIEVTGHSLDELSGEAANDNPRCARAVA